MVNTTSPPAKLVAFLVITLTLQGLVQGDAFEQQIPQLTDDISEHESIGISEIIDISLDVFTYPFRLVIFLFELATFQFLPGVPTWIAGPMGFMISFMLTWTLLSLLMTAVSAIGQVAPFT